jgi:serine protease AprX
LLINIKEIVHLYYFLLIHKSKPQNINLYQNIYRSMKKNVAVALLILFSILLFGIPIKAETDAVIESDFIRESENKIIKKSSDIIFSKDLSNILATPTELENDHDVIIRFNKRLNKNELILLADQGVNIRYQFKVINAASATASGFALKKISELDLVSYIESNLPMIRDMEMSLSVVNCTKAWDSLIVKDGEILGRIDGTGVTVCVVDTGIDAGHPDLDYGEKTLFNMHDVGGGNWIEMENSDVNFGHGTHVAGTVAGNGDASAGARSGVAPGANLIGLSVSIPEQMTTPTVETYIQGLEWVYEHSRPGNNPNNIRCATNSWHSSVGEYDPEAALSIIIEKLSYDNNIVTTWSAGNDGRDDPEGQTITTSQQGNTPVAVMVAAYERDGSAVTDFSSRGMVGWNHTYPDLGGPGRSIWSCSARRTVISGGSYVGGNDNPYYLAISGTSMSTPHIAGTVALLWQAAPSMRVSHIHEDNSGNDSTWWTNPRTLVHEVELILEASCTYLEPTEEHGVIAGPKSSLPGWNGRFADYVQGYGIVDVQRAVGIALALDELRNKYPEENISVFDAVENYDRISIKKNVEENTNVLTTQWSGEFSRYQGNLGDALSSVNQTKKIYIPEGASNVNVDLFYSAVDRDEIKAADLAITIDYGDDGSIDFRGTLSPLSAGTKNYDIAVSGNDGMVWTFDMIGQGAKIQNPFKQTNYVELRIEYDISVNIYFENNIVMNFTRSSSLYSELDFGQPVSVSQDQILNKTVHLYDLSNVIYAPSKKETKPKETGMPGYLYCLAALLIAVPILLYLYNKYKKKTQ